jgi:hypothetical protein
MANLNGFNAHDVNPATTFEPIPAGKYLAAIIASELKATKKGGGNYLELSFQILEGQYRNRVLWARLNLDNQNPTTVQIAKAELSAICRAVGVMTPRDSQDLHNLPLVISVRLKKRDDTGELANEVKGYSKKEAAAAPPQQQVAAGDTPPWARK